MTLRSPKHDRNAVRLDLSGFQAQFQRLWSALRERFVKVERLQRYHEPGDPSYDAFRSGDLVRARALVKARVAAQAALYTDVVRKGVQFERFRLVERPLSDYLEYEFDSYEIGAQYGERILIVDLSGPAGGEFTSVEDFLLFDDSGVLVHDYGAAGELHGAWFIASNESVRRYVALADQLRRVSVPLGAFVRPARV